jgi:hypothetical protein
VAADRPAFARLLAVAPAGRSTASYTITRDATDGRASFFVRAAQLRDEDRGTKGVVISQWIIPRIEWLVVYEIAVARAEPKLTPYLAPSTRTLYARPFICILLTKAHWTSNTHQ